MRIKFINSILCLIFVSISFLMSGCESTEDGALAKGQDCLDHATTEAQASACINDVSGYTSSQAYMIRCSANFVAQGITGSRFAGAISKIDDRDSSKSDAEKTSIVLSYFVAPSTNPLHTVETLYDNCKQSESSSVTSLAAIVKISTILARAVGGGVVPMNLNPNNGAFDSQSFIASIRSLNPSALDTEALGEVVKVVADNYCPERSKHRSDSFCISVIGAVNSSHDLPSLGEELIKALKKL